jgi:hypothetical protein
MRNLSAIRKELTLLGAKKRILNTKEVSALQKILHKDENIVGFLYGIFEGGASALMVCTNQRLLYINKTPGNLVMDDIPYDMVASTEYNTGILWGKVKIYSRSRTYNFSFVAKQYIEPFATVLEELMHKRRRDTSQQ